MKQIKKKWNQRILLFFLFLFIINFLFYGNSIHAIPSCKYGMFDVWISKDNVSWMNTTLDDLHLQCGQSFFIKAELQSTKKDIWVALYLFEPGTNHDNNESFIVVEGPCGINDGFDLGKTKNNETIKIYWKIQVKENPKWTEGFTPLSISAFFQKQKNHEWITEEITFSIAQIYIDTFELNEVKVVISSDQNDVQSSLFSSLHVLLIVCFFVIIVLYYLMMKK